MKTAHSFIFSPGVWVGKGKITFSMADDELEFTTRWTILPPEDGKIFLNQVIDMAGVPEKMRNNFTISHSNSKEFQIQLENHLVGKVQGVGVITPEVIAWEFRNGGQAFEGFEIYERKENGSYGMRGEFTSGDGMRTFVKGTLEKA